MALAPLEFVTRKIIVSCPVNALGKGIKLGKPVVMPEPTLAPSSCAVTESTTTSLFMVKVTTNCIALIIVCGAALVVALNRMPSNAFARPERDSVCVAPVVGTVS